MEVGVTHAFGVPDDFDLTLLDQLLANKGLHMVWYVAACACVPCAAPPLRHCCACPSVYLPQDLQRAECRLRGRRLLQEQGCGRVCGHVSRRARAAVTGLCAFS